MKPSCVRAALSDDSPEFFKEIPPAFLKRLEGKLPRKAILKDQTGKSWHVDLEERNEEYFFMNGWQAFVDTHLLEYGDFLIFRYFGNSVFNVKIFGNNGCIKNLKETANKLVPHGTIKDEPDVGQINMRLTVGHSAPVIAIKDESDFGQMETNITGSSCQMFSKVGPKSRAGRPKKVAAKFSGCSSKSKVTNYDLAKYPIYEFTVTGWSLHKVHIPKSLTDEYKITMGPKLVLEDQRGKQWPVKFYNSDGRFTLTTGWWECLVSNNIIVDDKCALELVLNRRNVCKQINVKIVGNQKRAWRTRAV